MAKRFLIIGAGGFAKEVAELVTTLGFEVGAYFTEESAEIKHPVTDRAVTHRLALDGFDAAAIAVGDTSARARFHELLAGRIELPWLSHPSAVVSGRADIGDGALVMPSAVIGPDARIGACAVVNVACYIAHDCVVGPYAHLAAATMMGGGSSVGAGAFCGTSTVVLPDVSVGDWSVCGAGAVVVDDVPARKVVVGVPARVTREA